MSASKTLLKIIIFIAVTITVGIWLGVTKGGFLGPMIGSCPAAYSGLMNLLQNFQQSPDRLVNQVWSCGIGVVLYIGLPGIGIGWFVAKHI